MREEPEDDEERKRRRKRRRRKRRAKNVLWVQMEVRDVREEEQNRERGTRME